MTAVILLIVIFAGPTPAQQPAASQRIISTGANPLAELKAEVERALTNAQLPFTAEQEHGIVIMMEDRREASEDLFGNLMDFQAGPTRGEDADRLRSAIEWMRQEFLTRLQDYLTPDQLKAWTTYRDRAKTEQPSVEVAPAAGRQNREAQTQYVRINNNSFTAEDGPYRFGQNGNGVGAVGAREGLDVFLCVCCVSLHAYKLAVGMRMINPSAPMASAARLAGAINSRLPVPCEGSASTGR